MQKLEQKSTSLGLELGSTRIKAVLAGPDGTVLASGAHDWQNRFEGGYWTYHLDEVWTGVQHAFRDLARNYEAAFGEPLRTVGALGVSAMMHGYLPFDRQGRPLTAFRTWRNTTTRAAADRAVPVQHSAAVDGGALLPGHPQRGGPCPAGGLPDDAGGLSALAAHGAEGPGHRGCVGRLSD